MKRVLSIFLSICLIMNFFVGIPSIAYAETETSLTCDLLVNDLEGSEAHVDIDESVKLSVIANSSNTENSLTYSWSKDGETLSETTNEIEVTKMIAYEIYVCTVSDGIETVECEFFLNPPENFVMDLIVGDEDFDNAVASELRANEEVTLTVEASSTQETPVFTYTWYISQNNGMMQMISGANSSTYVHTKCPLVQETIICTVSDGTTTDSANFVFNVPTTFSAKGYINDVETGFGSYQYGSTVTMRAEPYAGLEDAIYTYSWERLNPNTFMYEEIEEADNICEVTKGTENNGSERYRCLISDGNSSVYVEFYLSLTATFSVNQYIDESEYSDEDDYLCKVGSTVELQVEPYAGIEEAVYTYQWKRQDSDSEEYVTIDGTDAVLEVTKCAGYEYYCCVVSDGNTSQSVYFYLVPAATFSVKKYINDFEFDSDAGSYQYNSTVTMRVEPYDGLEGATYTYSWERYDSDADEYVVVEDTDDTCEFTKGKGYEEYCCNISDGNYNKKVYFELHTSSTFSVKGYMNDDETNEEEWKPGTTVEMRVEPVNGLEGAEYTYEWTRVNYETDENIVLEETGSILSVIKGNGNEVYTCVISDGITKREVDFYLYMAPTFSVKKYINDIENSSDDNLYKYGSAVNMRVEPYEGSENATYTYTWKRWDSDEDEYVAIGDTDNTCEISKGVDYEEYLCTISDGNYTKNVYFELRMAPTFSVKKYVNEIENGLEDDLYEFGSIVNMRVDPYEDSEDTLYTYTWKRWDSDEYEYVAIGDTDDTCEITKGAYYEEYLCTISDGKYTKNVCFELYMAPTFFTKQYVNDIETEVAECEYNSTVTMRVDAYNDMEGATYTYLWEYWNSVKNEYVSVGDVDATCEIVKGAGEEKYRCVVNDGIYEDYVYFYLDIPATFGVRTYINGEYTDSLLCATDSTITMRIEPVNGIEGATYTYVWKYRDSDTHDYVVAGDTDDTYEIIKGSGYEEYCCVVSDGNYESTWYFSLFDNSQYDNLEMGDWKYRVYYAEEDTYAEIVSYIGTAETVTIPDSVCIDGDEYPIYGMDANVFSNLNTLKHIDCNGFSISNLRLPLVVNCPNLESISMPGENAFMGGTIIEGLTNNKVTIKTYPKLVWYDENTDEEITIQDYCSNNNYVWEEISILITDLFISYKYYRPFVGLNEYPTIEYKINGKMATGKGVESISWSSSNEEVAKFDEKGLLTYGDVANSTEVTITAELSVQGQVHRVSDVITVYPKLYATKERIVLSPAITYQLPRCQIQEWLELPYLEYPILNEEDIPNTYVVSYTSKNVAIANVDTNGLVTAVSDVEGASTVITATYTDGTNTYKYDFTIEVGKASVAPFELPSTSGNKINIYSWNSEVPTLITDEFLMLYPQYKELINVVNLGMSGTSNEYKEAIANAIESKDANSPDIVAWDIDMLPYAMEQPYTIDLTDIGFDKDWYQYAYDYVRENGMDGDALKAVSWQGTPGCFLYRKDIAETVFGTSDADAIQEKVKDWDTFLQTAEQLKQAGYKVVSGPDDIKYNFTNTGTVPLFDNNVVNLGNQVTEYLTVAQELYENGYTNNTSMWDDDWSTGFDGDVFGYFGCTWFAYWNLYANTHAQDYMICNGPSDYYWGGSYITATNAGHNDELVKLIMYTLSCDENFLYRHTKETYDFSSNQNVSERMMAEGKTMADTLQNDPYPVWHKVANNVQTHKHSQYDMILNGCVDVGMTSLCNAGGAETVTEALDIIEARIKEYYPTFTFNRVKIESSTPVHTHTPVADAAVAATCTTPGKTEGSHCATCNEVIVAQTEIPATGHTEVADVAVAATCTEAGKTAGSHCSVCNAVIKAQAVVPATGHTEVVDAAVAPTCTEAGKTEGSHCSVCNVVIKEQTAISATGHRSDKGTVKEKSTTKKHGKKVYKCTICKETLKTEKLDKLPEVEDKKADYKAVQDEDGEIHIEYDGSKKKEKEVKIPDTIKDENGKEHKVTAIADDAFKGDKKVEEIKMGKNITEIGDDAFSGCKNLEEVTIGKNVTEIGDNAFKNCKSLDKVTIPSKVEEIGDNAFSGCKDLKQVKLGKKVEELGDNVFKGCNKLTEITLPANLDELGKNIFYGCKKLKKLVIQSKGLTTKTVEKNVFKGLPKTTTIYVPKSKLKEYKLLFKKKGLNSKVIVKGK